MPSASKPRFSLTTLTLTVAPPITCARPTEPQQKERVPLSSLLQRLQVLNDLQHRLRAAQVHLAYALLHHLPHHWAASVRGTTKHKQGQ